MPVNEAEEIYNRTVAPVDSANRLSRYQYGYLNEGGGAKPGHRYLYIDESPELGKRIDFESWVERNPDTPVDKVYANMLDGRIVLYSEPGGVSYKQDPFKWMQSNDEYQPTPPERWNPQHPAMIGAERERVARQQQVLLMQEALNRNRRLQTSGEQSLPSEPVSMLPKSYYQQNTKDV